VATSSLASPPALLGAAAAAEHLGVKPQTLRAWRLRGGGPAYVRLSGPTGRVAYRLADLDAWIAARTFTSTAAESAARATSAPKP